MSQLFDLPIGAAAEFGDAVGDLSDAALALVSHHSGATEPTNTYAFMFWADTTANVMKMRNAGDTAWLTLWDIERGGTLYQVARRLQAADEDAAVHVWHQTPANWMITAVDLHVVTAFNVGAAVLDVGNDSDTDSLAVGLTLNATGVYHIDVNEAEAGVQLGAFTAASDGIAFQTRNTETQTQGDAYLVVTVMPLLIV